MYAPISNLPWPLSEHFLMIERESPSMMTFVKPKFVPILTAIKHARVFVANDFAMFFRKTYREATTYE